MFALASQTSDQLTCKMPRERESIERLGHLIAKMRFLIANTFWADHLMTKMNDNQKCRRVELRCDEWSVGQFVVAAYLIAHWLVFSTLKSIKIRTGFWFDCNFWPSSRFVSEHTKSAAAAAYVCVRRATARLSS